MDGWFCRFLDANAVDILIAKKVIDAAITLTDACALQGAHLSDQEVRNGSTAESSPGQLQTLTNGCFH